MTYEEVVADVVDVVEATGAAIMIVGAIASFVYCARQLVRERGSAATRCCAATSAARSCSASRC